MRKNTELGLRSRLVRQALAVFADNYEGQFRGKYFQEHYKIYFNKNSHSFTLLWREAGNELNFVDYEVTLFLDHNSPDVVKIVKETRTERLPVFDDK
jgi:hypothetical protein